jgi:hypothetical protein
LSKMEFVWNVLKNNTKCSAIFASFGMIIVDIW